MTRRPGVPFVFAGVVASLCLLPALRGVAQAPLDAAASALRSRIALQALDRYLETWNSRNPALWATSLNYPHVRPAAGPFTLTRTPAEYAAGVDFDATIKTGWHHSEWVSRDVLQVGTDTVHVAGMWQRYTEDGRPLVSNLVTYVVTNSAGRWGIQSRFAAGIGGIDAAASSKNSSAAIDAVKTYLAALNAHDVGALANALHYPHVRIAEEGLEMWSSAAELLAGPEPGRLRTRYATRFERMAVVQIGPNGVNVTVAINRLGRDGRVLSRAEGLLLVTERAGAWKIQARSTIGS